MSIKVPGCQDLKVLGFKGDKGNKVTRVPRLKGLLRDRVFSRTHLRSSLTPEGGPSCVNIFFLSLMFRLNKITSESGFIEKEDFQHFFKRLF